MLTLVRRRINLDSQKAPSIFHPFSTLSTLLKSRTLKPTPRPHHALDGLVTRLLKLNRQRDALRVLDVMSRPNFGKDTSTFNPIIKWLTSSNDTESSWLVIRAMRGSNVEPDFITYNYMVRAYLWNETNVAEDLLRIMREKGMETDGRTNHELFLRVLRTRRVEMAVAMVRRMVEGGEVVLCITHCIVVRVMVVSRASLGKTLEYVRMVWETDRTMGGRVFGFLARKLGWRGRNGEARGVVGEMVKRGLPVVDKKLLRDMDMNRVGSVKENAT